MTSNTKDIKEAFRDHLVDAIALHAAALLKHGWIDQGSHDAILKQLPAITKVPQLPAQAHPPSFPHAPPTPVQQQPPPPQRPPPTAPRPSSVAHEPVPPPAPQRLPSASSVSSSGPTAPPPVPPSPAARKSVGAPTYRIAVKDYISKEDGDLNFVAGDVIEVIGEVDENWLNGSLKGKIGIFPKKFTDPKPGYAPPNLAPPPIPSLPTSPSGASSPQRTSLTNSQASIGPPTRPPPLAPKPRPTSVVKEAGHGTLHQIRSKYNGNLFGVDSKSLKALIGPGGETSAGIPISVLASGEIDGTKTILTFLVDEHGAVVPHVVTGDGEATLELRLKETKCGGGVVLTKRGGGMSGPSGNVPVGGIRLPMMGGRGSVTATTTGVGAWKVLPDGNMVSDRGNWHVVEDMGQLMVWDSPLEDQEWEVVAAEQ